ncbi:MAG: hypothetical protein ACREQ8_10945 [Woeseiaceae bacterium]
MYRRLISICMAISAVLLLSSCADARFASAIRRQPVSSAPVVPENNPVNSAAIRGGLRTALIITLDIRGQTFSVRNAQILKVPAANLKDVQSPGADFAVVRDKSRNEVGRAFVSRKSVRIREGHGVVQSQNQVETLAIPLTVRPATIEVQRSGQLHPLGPVAVPDVTTEYCKLQPVDVICRNVNATVIDLIDPSLIANPREQ